ncbi:hypothetical protein PXK01_19420 [Phaeobacter sp. PT47_59]|uniref:hypothetical protein n=1 Tax=Phaeobacter sp. PT47_59 TaxID=3029979 RepID=UPI002380A90E|nr:hypothetical protein [Phaeobacter sp. PT47_59]MDE4176331.1 hypothetical protein [Phaeobacter sp. PT47_59]
MTSLDLTTPIIEQARAIAATTPAGRFPPSTTTHEARRGQDNDPDNRGRSAHVFEQFNEERFGNELDAMHVIGIWAICTVFFGGTIVAAMILQPYITRLFSWLGL